jgi:transcriptional regulator with PAS, ATPase and Fis domain
MKHSVVRREPYNFGRPFDNRRPARLSILQDTVLDGRKSFDEAREDFVLSIILWALKKNKGNQAAAARQLGILRQTLAEFMARVEGRR